MWLEQLYANSLLSSGRVDEALQHYQESCAIEPRTEYCHYAIAHILLGRRQFRESIREYQFALRFTANPAMALLCLNESGDAWLQLGDYDAAEKSFAEALRIDPSNATALRLREQISNKKGGGN
jgi:tetratricopeptide (TPR) repeat protein